MDRTSKWIMLAIAAGLWLNAAGLWLKPVSLSAQSGVTGLNIDMNNAARAITDRLKAIDGRLESIEGRVESIARGTCVNSTICK